MSDVQVSPELSVPVSDFSPQSTVGNAADLLASAGIDSTVAPVVKKSPNPVRQPGELTGQLKSLGGEFSNPDSDVFKHFIVMKRVTGMPTITPTEVSVTKDRAVLNEDGTAKMSEDGKTPATEKFTVKELQNKVSYAFPEPGDASEIQVGDPFNSPTSALRAQAIHAKTSKALGMNVKEYVNTEYGKWYVTDPAGVKEGYKFFIAIGDLKPLPAPKPEKVKVPKEPKAPKEAKVKVAKEAKDVKAVAQVDENGVPVPTKSVIGSTTPVVAADDIEIA